uniref:ATP synthase F0 subunit 8 n=1 Tax=Lamennaisia nobilis TaxID=2921199 RepID=UPI001F13ED22|nr:ATP synthase F0 subunit 8 [Lamennaisia nobilis]UML36889.1 ATP synthase F0 subunit 8 [Lamennaisia sp.]
MPQMSPMLWLILYIYFLMVYSLFLVVLNFMILFFNNSFIVDLNKKFLNYELLW